MAWWPELRRSRGCRASCAWSSRALWGSRAWCGVRGNPGRCAVSDPFPSVLRSASQPNNRGSGQTGGALTEFGLTRLGPDRHPGHQIAGHPEAEVAGAVEAVAADLRGDHGLAGMLGDLVDLQGDLLADELR